MAMEGELVRGKNIASPTAQAIEATDDQEVPPARFREVMGKFATGVSVVSYMFEGRPTGLTANAFTSVSLDPPLVLVSIRNQSRFLRDLAVGDRYAINFLCDDQHPIGDHFGGRGAGVDPAPFQMWAGVPVIADCLASVVARAVDLHPAGDHTLVIGHVEHLSDRPATPLVYFAGRYERIGATFSAT
jgi:flavin reductase (DIM6/NTAB) family NADH-FMN oxidoreductase RutF